MKRLSLILAVLWLAVLGLRAQKACVIANAEDHLPLRDALVHTDNNHWARTDYRGYFTMRYQFDSATVSKPGFVKTTIYLKNLPDTVFLLPQSKQIGEVTVWGKNQEHIKKMEEQVGEAAADRLPSGPSLFSFDLGNMLDGRARRDSKHLKSARKVMQGMEKKDPIIAAYERATGKSFQIASPAARPPLPAADSLAARKAPASPQEREARSQEKEAEDTHGKASPGMAQKPEAEEKTGRKVKIGYEMEVGW